MTAEQAKFVCDRNFGVGGDGVSDQLPLIAEKNLVKSYPCPVQHKFKDRPYSATKFAVTVFMSMDDRSASGSAALLP